MNLFTDSVHNPVENIKNKSADSLSLPRAASVDSFVPDAISMQLCRAAGMDDVRAQALVERLEKHLAIATDAQPPTSAQDDARARVTFDLIAHLYRQRAWSERTFGPGSRAQGVVDHIRKELREVEADPGDVKEWIDVAILAFDGAWRSGAAPEQIVEALVAKQVKNEGRTWPDWRTMDPNKAIEHDRSADTTQQGDGL